MLKTRDHSVLLPATTSIFLPIKYFGESYCQVAEVINMWNSFLLLPTLLWVSSSHTNKDISNQSVLLPKWRSHTAKVMVKTIPVQIQNDLLQPEDWNEWAAAGAEVANQAPIWQKFNKTGASSALPLCRSQDLPILKTLKSYVGLTTGRSETPKGCMWQEWMNEWMTRSSAGNRMWYSLTDTISSVGCFFFPSPLIISIRSRFSTEKSY